MQEHQNDLIHESSLYLQQHARNPVNWVAWSDAAFETAKTENKLVLVSIGYSACHWCHVMEHECFEDEEVATLMNRHFVCIKVDREERPDIDQVYMHAVQLMTRQGGWPLNCFTLPDGSPVYGGTYFPKEQWMHILRSLEYTWRYDAEKVLGYGKSLREGINSVEIISEPAKVDQLPEDKLPELVRRWMPQFDTVEGGPTKAPKFPLPNNYQFLLHYGFHTGNDTVLKHVFLTLDKMAMGGIYDQLGGGFSRYSVDMLWKVPHFEKMLYDNGQLLALYAQAYRYDQKPEYERLMHQTLRWLEREMLSAEGGIYAAQDADSEGEEGKYYVWKNEELNSITGKDAEWFKRLFNPQNKGFWEHGNNILLRNESFEAFAARNPGVTVEAIEKNIQQLFDVRNARIHPVTDTKCLTAWNAMCITGLVECYRATGDGNFLSLAIKSGKWLLKYQVEGKKLWHTRQNGKSFISGMLDDYAFGIEALLELYQATANAEWLETATNLYETAKSDFFDEQSGMFWFTDSGSTLIARKMELHDNVIPSTNSVMAHNLLTLAILLEDEEYRRISRQQLNNMLDGMEQYGSGYSNWAFLLLRFLRPQFVIHASGTWNQPELVKLQHLVSPQVKIIYQKAEKQEFTLCGNGLCYSAVGSLIELEEQLRTAID